MKPAGSDPTASPASEPTYMSLGPPFPWPCPPDVRLCGHLRKQKSQRRRFFVLRADPPRLECYESQKKFLAGGCRPPRPRRSVSLEGACTISKRADARQRHLIIVYTSDSSLGVAAANEAEQQAWYSALLEVRAAAAAAAATAAAALGPCSQVDPESWILAPFQDVWPVTLRPKGLGRVRGLSSGGYRLCLGSGTLSLLRKPGSKGSRDSRASPPSPALRLSLLSVRRCGHADSFFFLELGRSAPTGPGELWLQAPDPVVAQSIHETVLAAMKRLGRNATSGKAELLTRDPPKTTSTPPVPTPYETPASAAQIRIREQRAEQDYLKTLERLGAAPQYPKGLEQGRGYISMGARADYVHMGGGEMTLKS
uniref:Insulin receptor substrate 3 n=1 Tax=Nannospalax galili TaxID=1026970 RepID=A0A8C6S3P7_NANGA